MSNLMNMITINRYWGDEQNESVHENNLQILLDKIEERKKRILQQSCVECETENLTNTPDSTNLDIKCKKKRKHKTIENNEKPVLDLKSNNIETVLTVEETSNSKHHIHQDQRVKKKGKHKYDSDTDKTCVSNLPINEIKSESNDAESTEDKFTILSNKGFNKTHKVKRVLPHWLAHPSVVSVDLKNLNTTINDIHGLDKRLASLLKKNKITHFFPVQNQLIPWLLKCHSSRNRFWPQDVCVSAPTGSGKTLAFVLPIIQILTNFFVRHIRALVVLPTKDLATQVSYVFKRYSFGTKLKVIQLGSGRFTVEKERSKLIASDEINVYRSLVDIVVTTPGRLVEHLKYSDGFSLSHLKFLVIDEADRVMESMQNDWLYHLNDHLSWSGKNNVTPYVTLSSVKSWPVRPQRLLFSATLSQDPEKLQHLGLFQPKLFTSIVKTSNDHNSAEDVGDYRGEFIGKYTTPNELTEYYTVCTLSIKPVVLYYMITSNAWNRVMCFVNSINNCHRLAHLLNNLSVADADTDKSLQVKEISSRLTHRDHKDVIEKFKRGTIDVLITTDSLARGIDILSVKYVILYDVPQHTKSYVHRVGRTGRAGKQGTSLTLVTPEQEDHFNGLLQTAGKANVEKMPVEISKLKHLEEPYKTALEKLRINVKKERIAKVKKQSRGKLGWKSKRIFKNVKRKKNKLNTDNTNGVSNNDGSQSNNNVAANDDD